MAKLKDVTDPFLPEAKGTAAASDRQIFVADGAGGGAYETIKDSIKITETPVFVSSDFTNQNPVGTDAPLQVKFGAGTGGGGDPVMVDAAGLVTFNQEGLYDITLKGLFGRAGAVGVSLLFSRILVNGVDVETSIGARLDSADVTIPLIKRTLSFFEAGDTLVVQILRDSSGNDSGGLIKESVTLAGWQDAPSAEITVLSIGLSDV